MDQAARLDGLTLERRPPTAEELQSLRQSVGWSAFDRAAAERGLSASLFGVTAFRGSDLAGSGRLVGDGALYIYVQDLIVAPQYQGQGIGRRVMQALMDHVAALPHKPFFFGLIAAREVREFYGGLGFAELSVESAVMRKPLM